MKSLKEMKQEYAIAKNKLNLLKANGSLSKLFNFRDAFDETFDSFFDQKSIRIKYNINYINAWDVENDKPNFDISNTDIEDQLDETDKEELINFYIKYIDSINDEIKEIERTSVCCFKRWLS